MYVVIEKFSQNFEEVELQNSGYYVTPATNVTICEDIGDAFKELGYIFEEYRRDIISPIVSIEQDSFLYYASFDVSAYHYNVGKDIKLGVYVGIKEVKAGKSFYID